MWLLDQFMLHIEMISSSQNYAFSSIQRDFWVSNNKRLRNRRRMNQAQRRQNILTKHWHNKWTKTKYNDGSSNCWKAWFSFVQGANALFSWTAIPRMYNEMKADVKRRLALAAQGTWYAATTDMWTRTRSFIIHYPTLEWKLIRLLRDPAKGQNGSWKPAA